MPISLGEKTITAPPKPQKSQREMSHDVYGCWDAYIGMQMHRANAVSAWERVNFLSGKIRENPDHPSTTKAKLRVARLEQAILDAQLEFLKLESNAIGYWGDIPERVRRKEALDEMFGVDHDGVLTPGMWWVELGSSPPPPFDFRIYPVVLQFAPVQIAKAYTRGYS